MLHMPITDLHCLNLPTLRGTESLQERASKALFPTNNSNEGHCVLSVQLFRVLRESGISEPQKLTKSSRQWSRAVIAIWSKHNIAPFMLVRKLGVREQHAHSLQPGRRRKGSELTSAWPQALFQNAMAGAAALDLCPASTCQALRGKDTHERPYSTGKQSQAKGRTSPCPFSWEEKASSFPCFRDKKTCSRRLHFHEVCGLWPPVVTWSFAPAQSERSAM